MPFKYAIYSSIPSQEISNLFSNMAKPTSPLSFLWQALLLPSKNPKLFSNVFLIYIISHAFLYTAFQLSIAPLALKLVGLAKLLPTIDPASPEFTEIVNTFKAVTKQLFIDEAVYFVFLFVISCSLSIIFYYASSAVYLGESTLTLKELLYKVKSIIKGPIITQLLVAFFIFIFLVIFGVIVSLISFFVAINNPKISSWFTIAPLTLLGTLLLLYFTVIWSMAVVVSVIEPTVYGIGAISRARQLLKGKKMQVFLLIFAVCIASGIIYVCNFVVMKFVSGSSAGSLVLGFVYQLLQKVVTLFSMMAVTVLYHECNSSQINGEVGNKFDYTKLATTNIV